MGRAVAWRTGGLIVVCLACVRALGGCEAVLGVGNLSERSASSSGNGATSGTASAAGTGVGTSGASAGIANGNGSGSGSGAGTGSASGGTAGQSGASTGTVSGADSSSGTAGGNGTGGASGSASGSSSGGTGTSAGTSSGASSGATSGAGATGATGGGSGAVATSFVDGGTCPGGAIFCDNFEEYTFVAANVQLFDELVPNWAQYIFHGTPLVDNTKPYAGKQAAHYNTEAGSYRFAGFVHQTPDGVPAIPLAHYGRVMVWLTRLPATSQWTIIEVQGLLAGSTTELATYGFGGNNGHLAASYTQRPRPPASSDGGIALRGGGPQSAAENAMAKLDCTKTATTETFPFARWVCVEWNIDAPNGVMHMWLDGVAQTEVDVAGHGSECTTGSPATSWQGPPALTKFDLVWEGYGADSPQQEGWFDEFAVSEQRIGCN
jgi:hypothetical protein